MLGHDMSWASFYVVEVMSSPKVHLKTVGYLAAAQSFTQDTDVLMLTTNQLKKASRVTVVLSSEIRMIRCRTLLQDRRKLLLV